MKHNLDRVLQLTRQMIKMIDQTKLSLARYDLLYIDCETKWNQIVNISCIILSRISNNIDTQFYKHENVIKNFKV